MIPPPPPPPQTTIPQVSLAGGKLAPRDVDLMIYFLEANDALETLSIVANGLDATAARQFVDLITQRAAAQYADASVLPPAVRETARRSADTRAASMPPPPGAKTPPPPLGRLDISWNLIRKQGALVLANVVALVRTLSLAGCGVGPEGCAHLADALAKPTDVSGFPVRLRELDLSFNDIGVHGAEALAESLGVNTSLTALNLRSNGVGPTGGAALARGVVRNAGRLRSLNLTDNHVGDDIATAISASLGNTPARLSAFSHKALRGPITINIAYKFPGMEDNFR